MTKRMLIDATHAEETRVVVLDGNRLEDFDVETSAKKQLKGNIYLAKVVRVEPSLQAAFVEYGGGRHGFLAFGEIHPDYYQIPVADRQRLLKLQEEEARAEEEDEDDEPPAPAPTRARRGRQAAAPAPDPAPAQPAAAHGEVVYGALAHGEAPFDPPAADEPAARDLDARELEPREPELGEPELAEPEPGDAVPDEVSDAGEPESELDAPPADTPPPETLGGESDVFEGNGADEARARRASRFLRNYRIQEVIRRRQIMLIQVVKEERGTKGAALTTYISLAGRFCVLMPNSPRGGGISRKITSAADRRRLKEITAELDIPQGMGLIVRTAGANRPKPEIKRDCEYLMRLWDDIREHTLRSIAPALIYEEASLIKRAIRDGYSRDIDEVVVDGESGWRAAHDFMRMLMPTHAKKVQLWRGNGQPLFSKHGVEDQLDSMLSPTVQLKSGGYLVINQAEALVAIDVNSGRSTRERGIEETALRTNLEAAEEAARQLRLRDLAGLIVIDFIDMESKKNNAMVERRLKEALKNDRARIQVGHISHFGLLEMSRQRLRPSLTETSFVTCPHCGGIGLVRNIESSAIHVLRDIEEEGAKARAGHIMVHVANAVAMYVLNNKRERLAEIEQRYAMRVHFAADETLVPPQLRIDRLRPALSEEERAALLPPGPVAPAAPMLEAPEEDGEELPDVMVEAGEIVTIDEGEPAEGEAADAAGSAEEAERRRRRRRRRRGGRREDGTEEPAAAADEPAVAESPAEPAAVAAEADAVAEPAPDPAAVEQPSLDPADLDENGLPRARRRGRRGGKRRRRDEGPEEAAAEEEPAAPPPPPAPVPVYTGPTPADPFGGQAFDIFDILERAEEAQAARVRPAPPASLAIPPVPVDAMPPADIEPDPVPEPAEAPVAAVVVAPAPEPAAESVPVSAPMPEPAAAPEPVPEPEPVAALPAEPELAMAAAVPEPAAQVEPAPEPPARPLVRPLVIGQDPLPETERKRGWWKRS